MLSLVNSVCWNVPLKPTVRFQSLVCTGMKFRLNSTPLFSIEPMLVSTVLPKFEPMGVMTLFRRSSV